MIQRKQTLFLLFSAIIMVAYIFAPVIRIVEFGNINHDMQAREMAKNVGFPVIGHYFVFVVWIAAWITAGINLITIFLYKNRKAQITLSWISIVPAVFCLGYVFDKFKTAESIYDQYFWYGNISPVVAIVFIFLAIMAIRQDEQLIKSVDRLR